MLGLKLNHVSKRGPRCYDALRIPGFVNIGSANKGPIMSTFDDSFLISRSIVALIAQSIPDVSMAVKCTASASFRDDQCVSVTAFVFPLL